MINKLKEFFDGKSVLILGFGLEGKSTFELLKSFSCKIAIADKNLKITDDIKNLQLFSGENYLEKINNFDIIMKSPGIALLDAVSEKTKSKITSQTDLLLRFCDSQIIGITGTKGKSTTSSLVHHFLKSCGKDTMLIGNIGVPPLERINEFNSETIIVCEMSCHQLEYVKASPNIAVLLNIYEEHLDHYVNFEAYKNAKLNIFKYQDKSDVLIYNTECSNFVTELKSEKISASYDNSGDIFTDDFINICGIKIAMEKIKTSLSGSHNLFNIAVALAVILNCECNLETAVLSLESFKGLPHRLENLGIYDGITFINDSISTIPNASIAALNAFPETDTIIIGGLDRGISYDTLIDFINASENLKNVILLPDSGHKIQNMIIKNTYKSKNLEEAVTIAKEVSKKCCILSPAAASYGFYKNFEERGEHFKELVNK